jgi:hypothetical protein
MLKRALKSILRHTPYRVTRGRDPLRFRAINECLVSLSKRGFKRQGIFDGGLTLGDFVWRAEVNRTDIWVCEPRQMIHVNSSQAS